MVRHLHSEAFRLFTLFCDFFAHFQEAFSPFLFFAYLALKVAPCARKVVILTVKTVGIPYVPNAIAKPRAVCAVVVVLSLSEKWLAAAQIL